MSVYADRMLDLGDFEADEELEDYLFSDEDDSADEEDPWASEVSPLEQIASQLRAAGWEPDSLGEMWNHEDHGAVSFNEASRIEAFKVYEPVPEEF